MSRAAIALALAMLVCFALAGCTDLARRHEQVMWNHYHHAGSPEVRALLAERRAAVERRQALRDLAAIRTAVED